MDKEKLLKKLNESKRVQVLLAKAMNLLARAVGVLLIPVTLGRDLWKRFQK
jgi:DNA-binding MltR family transcriptional regulator